MKSIRGIAENYARGISGFPRPVIESVCDHDVARVFVLSFSLVGKTCLYKVW